MSKLGCICGGTIFDQSDNLPNKGRVLRDQNCEEGLEKIARDIASFLSAKLAHNQRNWLRDHFIDEEFSLNMTDTEIIHTLLSGLLFIKGLDIFQCQDCHRLQIEDRYKRNTFFSFRPESEAARNVLAVSADEG